MSRDAIIARENDNSSNGTKSSNSNRNPVTINTELGRILRNFRKLRFEKSSNDWSRKRQFWFAFPGALSYFIGFFTFAFSTGVLEFRLESTTGIAPNIVISSFVVLIVLSAFFAWILSWTPKKTGPVRLYLSGIALPAFVATLIMLPLRVGNLIGG